MANSYRSPLLPKVQQHSKKKSFFYIASACFILFFSGILLGYNPIRKVMVHEGLYKGEDLDLAFFIGLSLMTILTWPIGILHDKYGPKKLIIFGIFSQIIGHLMLSFSDRTNGSLIYLISSFSLDSIANAIIFTSLFHFVYLFPGNLSIIAGIITGVWDLSSILGFVIEILVDFKVPFWAVFVTSSTIYLVFLISIVFPFYPKWAFQEPIVKNKTNNLSGSNPFKNHGEDNLPKSKLFTRKLFIFFVISVALYILQINFYLTNVYRILDHTLPRTKVNQGEAIFSLTFPFVGFIAAIGFGIFQQKLGLWVGQTSLLIFALLFSVMSVVPVEVLQYAGFIIYVIFRMVCYASINIFIPHFAPQGKIGTYLGITYGICGIVNFGGFGLTLLSAHIDFSYILICLGSLSFIGGLIFLILFRINMKK